MRYRLAALSLVLCSLGVHAEEKTASTMSSSVKDETAEYKISSHELKTPEKDKDDQRHVWVEFGMGNMTAVELKTTQGGRGWALASMQSFDLLDFSNVIDRKTGRDIDEGISEVAVMRTFSNHGRWFYTDASLGLGYMDSRLAKNCVERPQTGGWFSLGTTSDCDEEHNKGLSIPMSLSVGWGRYVGLGLKFHLSIGPESNGSIMVTLPLGTFAKR